jgi:hypothetical protein
MRIEDSGGRRNWGMAGRVVPFLRKANKIGDDMGPTRFPTKSGTLLRTFVKKNDLK